MCFQIFKKMKQKKKRIIIKLQEISIQNDFFYLNTDFFISIILFSKLIVDVQLDTELPTVHQESYYLVM